VSACPQHIEVLKTGVQKWNAWRDENPSLWPNLNGVDVAELLKPFQDQDGAIEGINFDRTHLQGAVFRKTKLHNARFNEAFLRHADFSGAEIYHGQFEGVKAEAATFVGAQLETCDFNSPFVEGKRIYASFVCANFTGANVLAANFTWAVLKSAVFSHANLSDSVMTNAAVEQTDFSDANLRGTKGLRLDDTYVARARFSADAKDPWSVLRREYTGPKFAFHLLLLIMFLLPKVFTIVRWQIVSGMQQNAILAAQQVSKSMSDMSSKGGLPPDVSAGIVTRIAEFKPCFARECERVPIWTLLLETRRPPAYLILGLALLVYNAARGLLTWRMGPLREEEERSGYTPPYKGPRLLDSYGWLMWPHRIMRGLLVVALSALAWHLYDALTAVVWLSPGTA